MRQTHTYVTLDVSRAVFDEVKAKLEAAGYFQAFDLKDGEVVQIDMHGLALTVEDEG
jgi:hypothetical protein